MGFPLSITTGGTATISASWLALVQELKGHPRENMLGTNFDGNLFANVVGHDGQPTTVPVVTAEVARRQPDGTWLWVIDQPNICA